jgi:hypothetical protein
MREVCSIYSEAFLELYKMGAFIFATRISSPSICGIMGLLFALFLPSRLLFCRPLLLLWYTNTVTFFGTVTFTFVIAAVISRKSRPKLYYISEFRTGVVSHFPNMFTDHLYAYRTLLCLRTLTPTCYLLM